MRIAVVSDLVRPNGAGLMALLGAEVLTGAGHDVALLGGAMSLELHERLQRSLVGPVRCFTHDEGALDRRVSPADHAAFFTAFGRWFKTEMDGFGPDLVYIHNCGRVFTQLDICDLSQRVPVIHTMHDEWFITDAHYTFRPNPGSPVLKRTFEPHRAPSLLEHRFDHLFDVPERAGRLTLAAPSRWLADRARRVYPGVNVEHLPNPIDTSLFALQDPAEARQRLGMTTERPIVLFVGNPTQARKGFAAFSAALDHADTLLGDHPTIRLVVGGAYSAAFGDGASALGSGPLSDLIAAPMSRRVGRVEMAGDTVSVSGIDRALMPSLYGAADLLIHPSRIDNLPTVPIEAGLCGTAVLRPTLVARPRRWPTLVISLMEIVRQPHSHR